MAATERAVERAVKRMLWAGGCFALVFGTPCFGV